MLRLLGTRLRNRLRAAPRAAVIFAVLAGALSLRGGGSFVQLVPWHLVVACAAGVACILAAVVRVPGFSRSHDDVLVLAGSGVAARAFAGAVERAAVRLRGLAVLVLLAAVTGNTFVLGVGIVAAVGFEIVYGTLRVFNTSAAYRGPAPHRLLAVFELIVGGAVIAGAVAPILTTRRIVSNTVLLADGSSAWPHLSLAAAAGLILATAYSWFVGRASAAGLRGAANLAAMQLTRTVRAPAARACVGGLFVVAAMLRGAGDASIATMLATMVAGLAFIASALAPAPWHDWYSRPLCYNAQPDVRTAITALIVADVASWTVPIAAAYALASLPGGWIVPSFALLTCALNRVLCSGAAAVSSDATFIRPLLSFSMSGALSVSIYTLYSAVPPPLFGTGIVALLGAVTIASVRAVERRLVAEGTRNLSISEPALYV